MPVCLDAVLTLLVLDSRSPPSALFSRGRAHAGALTCSVSVLLFLPPLSPSLSLLLWCVQKRKSSSSVHLMVSLACPPIRPLHAACARLPATQTHSAMCVCFTHPHCMSVLCGQVWPVLPGGGHCPRSPSGLRNGHWNVWYGIPCCSAWTAPSSPGQDVKLVAIRGQVASTGGDPHSRSLRRRGPAHRAQAAVSYRLAASGPLCGVQRSRL